jgi:anti-anti-sigma regulatory factor
MLKIERSSNGKVIFRLAGRLNEEQVAEMEALLRCEAATREMVLDLKDLSLVDSDAVRFLERCEAASIKLKNCPAYIRAWIRRERGAR